MADALSSPVWMVLLGFGWGLVGYGLWARWLARRFRLPEPVGERLTLELDRPGHHVGLTHVAPIRSRFREPVILCHGLAANRFNVDFHPPGSDRSSLARALVAEGFDVWILETRGHGHARVPKGARWSVHDEVEHDVAAAIRAVLELSGAERVFWAGHSWGGLLALLHQATGGAARDQLAGIIAMGSPGRFDVQGWSHPLLRPWLDLLPRLPSWGWPLKRWARWALPVAPWAIQLISRRVPQVARLSPDSLRYLLASVPENIPACKIESLLHWGRAREPLDRHGRPVDFGQVRCPVYLVGGDQDWIAPPAAVMAMEADLTGAEVQVDVFGGPDEPFGHAGLLLGAAAPRFVFPAIVGWLQQHATPHALQPLNRMHRA